MSDRLTTLAEDSDFTRTGRYDEVLQLCEELPKLHPKRLKAIRFGTTPEQRPMMALVASNGGHLTPEAARQSKLPVLLLQGCIHPGESDGKDAGFSFLQDLLTGKLDKTLLDRMIVLFIPVLNIDGHERFSAWNRPNQNGPVEMGWRVTAQNLNLNRDYTKIESPEMAAALRLINGYDPLVFCDMHATNGANFECDLSIMIDPSDTGQEPLKSAGLTLRRELFAKLEKQGHTPVHFYPTLNEVDDPASGFGLSLLSPRYSNGYWGARNRLGFLVETHSWKPYKHRVRSTYDILVGLAELLAVHGPAWQKAAETLDREAPALAGKEVVLTTKNTTTPSEVAFRGCAYKRTPSEVSGALRTEYDSKRPEIWRVPYFGDLVADVTVEAPRFGYVVSAAYALTLGDRLALHGLRFETLKVIKRAAKVKAFRTDGVKLAAEPFEGRQRVDVTGTWKDETRDLPAGSLIVPIEQAGLRLLLFLLEPRSPDSFLAWGYFNACFEKKEYMEPYVAEVVARELLKKPEIKTEFEARLKSDPAFAKSPAQRLDFFYRKHSSWDETLNLYPVFRLDQKP